AATVSPQRGQVKVNGSMAPRLAGGPAVAADAGACGQLAKSTGLALSSPTPRRPYGEAMPTFEVTLRDGTVEVVDGADAYQQEGPMTTFFRRGEGREVIDSWSTRMASFRTADLLAVRRREPVAQPSLRAVAGGGRPPLGGRPPARPGPSGGRRARRTGRGPSRPGPPSGRAR